MQPAIIKISEPIDKKKTVVETLQGLGHIFHLQKAIVERKINNVDTVICYNNIMIIMDRSYKLMKYITNQIPKFRGNVVSRGITCGGIMSGDYDRVNTVRTPSNEL